ncbi:MAG: DNA-processing protein DprA [Pseudomonadota bacterium]
MEGELAGRPPAAPSSDDGNAGDRRDAIDDAERLDRLRLARAEGVGPITYRKLLARFGTAAEAIDGLKTLGGRKRLSPASIDVMEAERDAIDRVGGRHVALGEPDYPARLARIDDPPPVLCAIGDLALAARETVAIVGGRNASSAGRALARQFAAGLGEAGCAVVSGLARGIDGAAHEASLEAGAIAVVAGGVDIVYPPEHGELQSEIARRGLLLSERPPGLKPTGRDFPRRNRIVSGLARAVVVIEASARSGTLITARLAAEQGRDVLAAPGSPLDPRSEGSNRLIRNGAGLVASVEDILNALGDGASWSPSRLELEEEEIDEAPGDLTEAVREQLSHLPVHPDVVAREMGVASSIVGAALVELVLMGEAVEEAGGYALSAEG